MCNRVTFLVVASLLAPVHIARAQESMVPAQPEAAVDIGLRFTDITGDAARFQRFRDMGDGAFFDRFRFDRNLERGRFALRADHVGRRDQRYVGEYQNGKVTLSFQWDQVPLWISRDTRTLFAVDTPGVLRVDDGIQRGIETGQFQLADVVGQAASFELKSRRDTAAFKLLYSPRQDVDVKLQLKSASRSGTMPWGASFGFFNAVEVPAPIDTRTTDAVAGVEWAEPWGSLRVGYDGSWFNNHIPTLTWDNPLKLTDSTSPTAYQGGTGGAQGRAALWPDSTLHAITTAGSLKLPARTSVAGNVSVGTWRQNATLLPFTINSAIPAIPLERATAEGDARTLAMNYTVTSRPSKYVWLNTRFRYYDFDNRTPVLPVEHYVRLDQVLEEHEGGSKPRGYTRSNLDIDTSFTPVPFTAVRVGYGRNWTDRTFRIFDRTTEDVYRASVDGTHFGWLTLRAIIERSLRNGSGFQEMVLVEANEQLRVRHFDIADRDRTRVTGLVQVTPIPAVSLTASAANGKEDYKHSGLGLRDNENRSYVISTDFSPSERVGAGVSYTIDRYAALQNSREFGANDWSLDSDDNVHAITANLDLLKIASKTEARFAYNFTRSKATYVYLTPPGSAISAPAQLPRILNELHTGTADVRYFLTTRLAIGVMYWYERYNVDDFEFGPGTLNRLDLPGSLFLGYVYRPYTAHSTWARLLYFW
jgi:MtrB/PioB family decaheme-associated outer membrane protein